MFSCDIVMLTHYHVHASTFPFFGHSCGLSSVLSVLAMPMMLGDFMVRSSPWKHLKIQGPEIHMVQFQFLVELAKFCLDQEDPISSYVLVVGGINVE